MKSIKDDYIFENSKGFNVLSNVTHKLCGHTFELKPAFLSRNKDFKCPICQKGKYKNFSIVKILIEKILSDDYLLLSTEYKTCKDKLLFKHIECGNEFYMTYDRFKAGNRCPKCSHKESGRKSRRSKESILNEIHEKHNGEYTLLSEFNTVHDYVTMKHNSDQCSHHEYKVLLRHVLYDNNKCPLCNQSSGEYLIRKILEKENILFKMEVSFDKCRNKLPLPFDFQLFLSERDFILIEYDGLLHFQPFGGKNPSEQNILDFKKTQRRDKIKTKFCKDNNIQLIRIKYTDKDNLSEVLNKIISKYKVQRLSKPH